jgi:F0F1-type ATP synthase alpha subunit
MLTIYKRIFKASKQPLMAISACNFSGDFEASTILSQLNQKLTIDGEDKAIIDKPQVDIKDNVMYVSNFKDIAKLNGLININNTVGLCISVEKALITALILNRGDNTRFISKDDVKIPLKHLGNVIDFSGQLLLDGDTGPSVPPECDWHTETLDLIGGLQKAPFRRKLVSKQLYTGHLRIDLNQPMVCNN